MTIKTKFSIGDKVYCINPERKVLNVIVAGIFIWVREVRNKYLEPTTETKMEIMYKVKYNERTFVCEDVKESELYATKDELAQAALSITAQL